MSHELRTPLNTVIGFSSVLLERLAGPLNDQQAKQVSIIHESSRHLLALINDLLDISRIEAGHLKLDVAESDIENLLRGLADSFTMLAAEKGLAFALVISGTLPRVHTDERRVRQILTNLVSNAIKYTDTGRVVVQASVTASWMEVTVQDTGMGIPADDIGKLFRPFTQLQPRDGKLREGTGLGLAIAWRLARALGGELSAASRLGEGSRFTLRLPLTLCRGAA